MKTAIFIPVRIGSTRLSGKPLLEIKGKKIIEHLIERMKTAKLPEMIVLCTTEGIEDKVFFDIAKRCGIECFAGSTLDILDRFFQAAKKFSIDFIVAVDGDDILCDPPHVDKTIELFKKTDADFITCKELPLGAVPNGIKVSALEKVIQLKKTNNTATGWGGYFTDTGLFKVEYVPVDDPELKRPDIRLTMDYPEDFEFMSTVFDRLYNPEKMFSLKDLIALLKADPSIENINKNVSMIYWQNFKRQKNIQMGGV